MANARPRVLIRVSQGFVTVHSSSELTLTIVDDDLQVRCDMPTILAVKKN